MNKTVIWKWSILRFILIRIYSTLITAGYEIQIRCIPFKLRSSPFHIQSFTPYFLVVVATDSPRKDHPKIRSPMTVINFYASLSSPALTRFLASMLCLLVSGLICGKQMN